MEHTVTVALGERSYPIRIGRGLLGEAGKVCRAAGLGGSALVVTDRHVGPLYAEPVTAALRAAGVSCETAVVAAGEASKDHETLFRLYDAALDAALDRHAFIVALGGGVVGDLAGYAAASYLRGIAFVQLPTSLLAMVDSAVGGKTGINLPRGKNLVGAFHQPRAVLADLDTLRTLPFREFRSGLAEVIKYGAIADAAFLGRLEETGIALADPAAPGLAAIVSRCCELKAEVVGADERERGGRRATLNFGHTLGHALEAVAGYGRYLHGEAVAVGMVYAARLSVRAAGFPAAEAERLTRLLAAVGLPVRADTLPWRELRAAMTHDKKAEGGTPRFVLLEAPGRARTGVALPEDLLKEVWDVCRQ